MTSSKFEYIYLACALMLTACTRSVEPSEPARMQETIDGVSCTEGSLRDLTRMKLLDLPAGELRFKRVPEFQTPENPGMIAWFRDFAPESTWTKERPEPSIEMTLGDIFSYCTTRIPETSCPESRKVYESLLDLEIGSNHYFGKDGDYVTIHPNVYRLTSSSGNGSMLDWISGGNGGKPYGDVIDEAAKKLEHCAVRVVEIRDQFSEKVVNRIEDTE